MRGACRDAGLESRTEFQLPLGRVRALTVSPKPPTHHLLDQPLSRPALAVCQRAIAKRRAAHSDDSLASDGNTRWHLWQGLIMSRCRRSFVDVGLIAWQRHDAFLWLLVAL